MRLFGLVERIAPYPVEFSHVAKLGSRIEQAVCVPVTVGKEGGYPLRPLASSRTVKQFFGTPFTVYFDGSCPTKSGLGSCGMPVIDTNGDVLLMCGEYDRGCTSNHAEFLELERALKLLVERG